MEKCHLCNTTLVPSPLDDRELECPNVHCAGSPDFIGTSEDVEEEYDEEELDADDLPVDVRRSILRNNYEYENDD